MIDLAPIFSRARQLAAGAIQTAGTEVTLTTGASTVTTPGTLERTTTPGVATPAKAIVTQVQSSQTGELLPGVTVRAGDLRVVLLPTVSDPAPGVVLTVTKCRDARLVGAKAKVIGAGRSSAGAVLLVYARPVRPS